MNSTQSIYSTLVSNGTYFFDFNVTTRIMNMSDTLRYMLGFDSSTVHESVFQGRIPAPYNNVITPQFRHEKHQWVMPIEKKGETQWLRVERLTDYVDVQGDPHSVGIVIAISEEEAKAYVSNTGISSETIIALLSAVPLMNNTDTFYTGIHRILSKAIGEMKGMSLGVIQWLGGYSFQCTDFVGVPLYVNGGHSFSAGHKFLSPMIRDIVEGRKLVACNDMRGVFDDEFILKNFVELNRLSAYITMPLVCENNETWGCVTLFRTSETIWDSLDMDWITIVAKLIVNCISQMKKIEMIQTQLEINRMANQVSHITAWSWDCSNSIDEEFVNLNDQSRTWDSSNMHPQDQKLLRAAKEAVYQGTTSEINIVLRSHQLTGGRAYDWYQLKGRVIRWSDERHPQLVVGVVRNVTEQVRDDNERERRQRFKQNVYDKLPVGILVFKEDGTMTYTNDKVLDIFGIKQKRRLFEYDIFHLPVFNEDQVQVVRSLETEDFVFTCDFSKKQLPSLFSPRELLDVMVRVSKVFERGRHKGFLVVVIDNTLLASQARRLTLFNSYWHEIGNFARVGVFWKGQGQNNFASEQWVKNFNAYDSEDMYSCQHYDNIVAEDLQKFREQYQLLMKGEVMAIQQVMRVRHDDGIHWISLNFVRNDNVGGVTGISIDVSDQKRNEELLIKARDKAERMDMLKSQFLANMSHEIRTPLNAIVGFSSLIAETDVQEDRETYFKMVSSNTELLLKLINDILDLSKIESGTLEFSYGINNINDLCHNLYESLKMKCPEGIDFVYDVRPEYKGVEVYCDRLRISQVIINFVTNAFKFTTKGSVTMWYELTGNRLIFHVRDTGKGIANDQIDHIFESFVKLDAFANGTGIGLAISKSIASQMGGYIEVDSEVGKGSHFRLVLPNIDDDKLYWREAIEWQSTIMVMSFNNELFNFISFSLEKKHIIRAENVGFLQMWLEKKPPLTLIDVSACEETVLDFVSCIRTNGDRHKVVCLLPDTCTIKAEVLLKGGANDVIEIPTTHEKFMSKMNKFLL